jgi:hypothetical protein
MGVVYDELSLKTRVAIERGVECAMPSMNEQEVANSIYS